jgi:TM2 domain-containing membrane protein YozV
MGDYRPIDPREPLGQQQSQWQQPPYPGPEQQSQWQQPPQPWPGQQPQWQQPPYPGPMMGMGMQKSWITTVLLCQFVGTLGIHRFYTGRIVSGIFQLLTFGGFGIWTLIDLIMIYTDSFTDDRGMPLTRMEGVRPNVYMRNPQVKD